MGSPRRRSAMSNASMLDETDRPDPPASEASPAAVASPWSRDGSPEFVVDSAPTAAGAGPAPDSIEALRRPQRDRRSASRWIIVATAATAAVVAAAVFIVHATRPDAPIAAAPGASVTD